jgi:hypothetical protein
MSYQDRLTSPGPARDDPLLGETTEYSGEHATDTGKQQAQNVASTAKGEAANVASTAKEEARNVAQTAQGQARKLAGDARTELKGQADTQVNRLADGIGQISQQLRSMGTNGDPGPVADIASEAAERAQQVADRLRQGGVDDAVAQVRSLGRNRPGLFLLGAFGVGLVAGRVVRNLAEDPTDGDGYRTNRAYDSGYSGTSGYGNAGYATTAYDSYATSAPAVGDTGTLPPADPASAAYGAPATPDYAEGTAPVGEQRWGT